jgi:hypothetical protein
MAAVSLQTSNGIHPGDVSQPCPMAFLPNNVMVDILKQITEFNDVAHVNCVCKGLKNLNQDAAPSKYTIGAQSNSNQSCFDATKPYTYVKSVQEAQKNINDAPIKGCSFSNREILEKIRSFIGHDAKAIMSLLKDFAKMQPDFQMEAFLAVISAENSNGVIAHGFYNAMPKETQAEFKRRIGIIVIESEPFYAGQEALFGEIIIARGILSEYAIQTATQYLVDLRASSQKEQKL